MKRIAIALVAALSTSAAFAYAGSYFDTATVISANERVNRVATSHQECSSYQPNQSNSRGNSGAVLGGIAGALLGSQVGGGNGNKAAIAGGAVLGAITGDRMQNDSPSQACREVTSYRDQITGYDVVYRYNGRDYSTTMQNYPGRTIQVRVSVDPQ